MTNDKKIILEKHFKYLQNSYNDVFKKTWMFDDFSKNYLNISRNLFEKQSLLSKQPRPKNVIVYALLSGLPFEEKLTRKLLDIQRDISKIIKNSLHYWVKPQNLGVEYCVFKWPDDPWENNWLPIIKEKIYHVNQPSYFLDIKGVQVNQDGCIVARGYDNNCSLFLIREHMKNSLKFLPKRQSGWAHIPMGRILEPVGKQCFKELNDYFKKYKNFFISSIKINEIHFVKETRWYMEERDILLSHSLNKS